MIVQFWVSFGEIENVEYVASVLGINLNYGKDICPSFASGIKVINWAAVKSNRGKIKWA